MSLYLLLPGRQESPHHCILSVQASLAQPDFQLVGHSNTHSGPPRCFLWSLRANRCCQTLPGTSFPGFLPHPFLLPLWASCGSKLLSPAAWPHAKQLLLISSGSQMTQVTFMLKPGFIGRSPEPCPFHLILRVISMRCQPPAPVESAAAGRQPLPPSAGAKILQERVSLPFQSGSGGNFSYT